MVRRNQVEKDPKRNKEKQSYSKNMPRDCNFRLKCLNIQRDKEQKKNNIKPINYFKKEG